MGVVVPFAVGQSSWALPSVQLALKQDGVQATFVQMVDDESYYKLLVNEWNRDDDLIVIEHDIVVWPGAIQELLNCKEVYCTLPYYCSVGWIIDGLGCTKFSRDLKNRYPYFLRKPFPPCCSHTTYYCGLDRLIAHKMESLGIKPHIHAPGVVNLNSKWT